MCDGLTDPPHGVGDELYVPVRIEPPARLDQPEIAFVNEIEEGHAKPAVALGVADDKSEVAFDEPAERRLIAVGLDAAGQLAFFFRRQTREFRNGTEIRPQRISIVRGGVRHTDIIRATRPGWQ